MTKHPHVRLTHEPEHRDEGEIKVVRVDPATLAAALRRADGDPRRVRPRPDGSVVVLDTRGTA